MKKIYSSLLFICFLLLILVLNCRAQSETIKAGSFIINMGVTPQTFANGLKPYGMVYDLVKNYKVPVRWIINTAKEKDGIDFSHNGVDYTGGTFIVPFEFRTDAINTVISIWQAQGVVGNTSVSDIVLDVYKTIYYVPNWTLDYQNGALAAIYFENAGIPASAHGGSSNWKTPDQLNACDDIFVMPHADPTWSTHNNLYYWNRDHKGNIWAACHAVSELEAITDPTSTIQLNFLSTNGLVKWSLHKKDDTPPYQYQDHGNPIMQFVQTLDGATQIGSEQTYLPVLGSSWRSTTTVGVYDTTNNSIPSLSAGPAAIVAYGRAYGDDNRGYVMYEAGHDHNAAGSVAEKVAAQRAFLNYSFLVAVDRYAHFEPKISGLPDVPVPNQTYNLSFTVPAGVDLSNYTIQWSSNCGGTFSATNTQTVIYTAPATVGACIVTVTLTDGCDRQLFASEGAYVATVLSSSGTTLRGAYKETDRWVELTWTAINTKGTDNYEIQRSADGKDYQTIALFFPDMQTANTAFNYKDKYTVQGTAFYRLKINATDKAVGYSNVIKVMSEDAVLQLKLLMNPVQGNILFECESPVSANSRSVLYDMNGKIVQHQSIYLQKGVNRVKMAGTDALPAGTYLLQVVIGGKSITQKIQLVK